MQKYCGRVGNEARGLMKRKALFTRMTDMKHNMKTISGLMQEYISG